MTDKRNGVENRSYYRYVKDASIRGSGIGVITFGAKALLDLGSVVVLARLLTPTDFGLVAMAGTFLNFLRIVGDWGLVMASTQRPQMNDDQLSTLFWINVAGGVLLSLVAIVSAPVLVKLYNEPRILGATLVLSIALLAIGLGAQHEAIVRRRMRYGYLHVVSLLATAIGLIVGIVSALAGLGMWSLVLYQVATRLTHTLSLWCGVRWRPGRPQRQHGILQLVRYGIQFVPVQLLTHLSRSIGEVVVGVGTGATDLGVYRRANGVATLVEQMKQPLKSIMPASLSRLQHEEKEFLRFYVSSLSMWALVACGVVGYVTAESTTVVRIVLGDQWLSASPLIRWLAPAALASALGAATEWLLLPLGDVRRLLVLRIVRTFCVAVGVVIGWRWGVSGVALGYSVGAVLGVTVELCFVATGCRFGFFTLAAVLIRPMAAAIVAIVMALIIQTETSDGTFIIEFLVYLAVYLLAHSVLPGGWTVTRRLFHSVRGMMSVANR